MGLTSQSTGLSTLKEMLDIQLNKDENIVIALAGNPNTGKSTVFNSLTGLNQHTGNWTGKTVATAHGKYNYQGKTYTLVDLPGTYSLLSNSAEEEIARDFICFANPQATVIVTDATRLERNLNLVLQILEMTDKVVVCVNLIDEAQRKKIKIDLNRLAQILGVPVVATNARSGAGLEELKEAIKKIACREICTRPLKIRYDHQTEKIINQIEEKISEEIGTSFNNRWLSLKILDKDKTILNSIKKFLKIDLSQLQAEVESLTDESLRDTIATTLVKTAEQIAAQVVSTPQGQDDFDKKLDDILTSKTWGIPTMIALLGLTFWLTIEGADIPSQALANLFFSLEELLSKLFVIFNFPNWLHDILVLGVYRTLAWVISVMLPPMAIFFPLFTLLEDLGYLPRVAFNLDNFFKKACAHGKQALTMCMGFGCNAAGVIGCRIIDSPRERLIAILTNAFVPCNGRFPTLITIATIFVGGLRPGFLSSLTATLAVTVVIVLGVVMTLVTSRILSKTILKGVPSSFTLELPPYRKPQLGRIIVRSILDRTIFVLGRAALIAAPAGLIIWLMANVKINSLNLLSISANFLQPFANLLGLDGYILMAFILGLPANEIVIPILIMSYMASGTMLELESLETLRNLLVANGWTWLTAINVMLFCLFHFPCGTTLLTIRKETKSWKWTFLAWLIPTFAGIAITFTVTQVARLLGY